MTRVRISFYIYLKDIVNFLIAGWTFPWNIGTPPASHVEIGFFVDGYLKDKKLILNPDQDKNPRWWYFSSTMRDKENGARWSSEKDLHKNPERWITLELENWQRPYFVMIEEANFYIGTGYDKLGISGFVLPIGLNDKKKWYCSEIVYKILMGVWKRLISPRRLFPFIIKLGASYVKKSR